jgi:carbonic anhydrase
MGTIQTIMLGFGGCGAVAAIAWFLTSRSGGKSKITEVVNSITQRIGHEKIQEEEDKKHKLTTEIEIKEEVAEEVKTKINKIQEDAANEINEVLKENNISRIHTVIDSEWEDL